MKDVPKSTPAIPGSVTMTRLALGLVSIVMAAKGQFEWAAWLIVWSSILDKIDGCLARRFNAGSDVGIELDSFADFTAFGIAPAAYTWFRVSSCTDDTQLLFWAGAASIIMVVAAAIRLAVYNIKMCEDRDWFTGVASTFVGGLFVTLVLSLDHLGIDWNPALVLPSVAMLGAILMLSKMRIPKLKTRKSKVVQVIQVLLGTFCVLLSVFRQLPEFLFLAGATYLVGGAILGRNSTPGPN